MFSFFTKIRFLPLTIFAAALTLTVRMGDIWDGMDSLVKGSGIDVAVAQAQSPAPPAPPPAKPAGQAGTSDDKGAETQSSEPAIAPLGEDPTLLTQAEIELLQQLAVRREELESREKQLVVQTSLMKAAESRINKKVDELRTLQTTIEKLIQSYDQQQDKKLQSLVKVYESMKPKQAARIFEELDMTTLLSVVERMKERKLAAVMAQLNPAKAKEVTVELTRLRDLPQGEDAGG